MLRRVISQVIRLQAPHGVCSDKTISESLASASSLGSLVSFQRSGSTSRCYQTGRLWGDSSRPDADGRDVASQVLETSRILLNRKLLALEWSPHGISLIPKLARLPLTGPLDEQDEDDESSDGKILVSILMLLAALVV